jgi:hypothetical protein
MTYFGTSHERNASMNTLKNSGKSGYLLLWLPGIPVPVLSLSYPLRDCT